MGHSVLRGPGEGLMMKRRLLRLLSRRRFTIVLAMVCVVPLAVPYVSQTDI